MTLASPSLRTRLTERLTPSPSAWNCSPTASCSCARSGRYRCRKPPRPTASSKKKGFARSCCSRPLRSPDPARRTRTQEEKMEKPIDLISRFCAAWGNDLGAEDLAAFFTDDAVYHNIPLEPITGRENIADNIASFIRPGAPGIERIEFRVINIAANGPVVMTERVDVFTLAGKTF